MFFGTLKKINIFKRDGTQCNVDVKISKGLPANSEIVHNLTDGNTISKLEYIISFHDLNINP